MAGTESGSCLMVGFDISNVELSGSPIRMLVT
jgi:hypothetical protein